jgi:hypothetical protein
MSSQALCAKLGIPAGIPCGTHADLVRSLWLPSRACGSRHVAGVSSQHSSQIENKMRLSINYITKEEFLPAFFTAYR